ncbi:MAG TPA: Si-specific NAD(P)(+) transhydrogenase [Phycisphaerales bacterium]|nr:Si-specific NAD(P)(+) transhydrogenase [Phycisphaerales bacterium]
MRTFDLCVIGSGPGGSKAAIAAAKLGKRVVVIEKMDVVGGAAINTGTIPSKALREAVLAVTAARHVLTSTNLVAGGFSVSAEQELQQLIGQCHRVITAEVNILRSQLLGNGVEIMTGMASFVDAKTVRVEGKGGVETVRADHFVIGVGTSPSRPPNVAFDNDTLLTSDEVLRLAKLPRSMIVVGGGVIGSEYASMLAALGVRVTLIEGRPRLLEFIDTEIGEALQYHLRQMGVTLRTGEKVVSMKAIDPPRGARSSDGKMAEATLESGKTIVADSLMYCVGRQGNTAGLALEAAGLSADARGRITVDANYKTKQSHIYAVGDVIGFPALASTSMEQGRLAAMHMYGEPCEQFADLLPYGIYSIPEISMVGWTEERLTAEGIPFESGVAHYREIARGQLLGDSIGMLKLLIHQETHAVLGAHAIGSQATELIHIAQAVMAFKGTVEYFVNTVFNYPTLAECYKVAAYNGLNKLRSA